MYRSHLSFLFNEHWAVEHMHISTSAFSLRHEWMDKATMSMVAADFIDASRVFSMVEDLTMPGSILAVTYYGLHRMNPNGSISLVYNFQRRAIR